MKHCVSRESGDEKYRRASKRRGGANKKSPPVRVLWSQHHLLRRRYTDGAGGALVRVANDGQRDKDRDRSLLLNAAHHFSAFFGGALVDRLGYKRMSVVSDITSGVS